MDKTKVAIIGLGTVGTGVARLLLDFGDRIARHAGKTDGVLTDSLADVIEDPEITVVAQLIGGLEPARSTMLRLLESGKDVVTANKALLAEHGPELFDRARELGRSIAFEASVAGGIPIIANIGQYLSANQILSLQGILNGTSNFILSQMHDEGANYHNVLAEAQRLGYAEADPSMDVDGSDASQKLSILAHLAFGARVAWQDIPCTGIENLDLADVRYAHEMGYKIKLLAIAQLVGKGLELHVSPTLVRNDSPLAQVSGPDNAIRVAGDAVGQLLFCGAGAGQMPTASAVVADMIDTAVGRTQLTFRTLELWSNREARVTPNSYSHAEGRFYLRIKAGNHPGVLAQITTALGDEQISIAMVLQHESEEDDTVVPLVVMTHEVSEGSIAIACERINALDCVHGPVVRMWVRD